MKAFRLEIALGFQGLGFFGVYGFRFQGFGFRVFRAYRVIGFREVRAWGALLASESKQQQLRQNRTKLIPYSGPTYSLGLRVSSLGFRVYSLGLRD